MQPGGRATMRDGESNGRKRKAECPRFERPEELNAEGTESAGRTQREDATHRRVGESAERQLLGRFWDEASGGTGW